MEILNKILILGAGALGSNLATNLAVDLRDKAKIAVLDFDKVEPRNYQAGTQFYRKDQLGMLKVKALALNIYTWHGIIINTFTEKIGPDSFIGTIGFNGFHELWGKDLIIDTFDNYEARKIAYGECKEKNIPCLHIGFSPKMTFEICWNEQYEVPDDLPTDFDICTAEGARSFIQYVSALASNIIQKYLKDGKKINYIGNAYSVKKIL